VCDALRDSISPDPATKDVLARWADVLPKLEIGPDAALRASSTGYQKAWDRQVHGPRWLAWRNRRYRLLDLQIHDIRPEKGVYYALALNDQVTGSPTRDDRAGQARAAQTTRARLRGEFIRQANLKGKDYRVTGSS